MHLRPPRPSLCAICLLIVGKSMAQIAPPAAPAAAPEEKPVELSPFVIQESKNDSRYYAENTLAGSRLNSNLGDLGASITVVTKQQLTDTAARDMNDVFLYEANTEGTGNYTAFAFDARGSVSDYIAGNQAGGGGIATSPGGANRIRGLTQADNSTDYYPSIVRLPFDTYNTERVEISRGPNAILFGLGRPGGFVNQSTARANPHRRTTEVSLRADSLGGRRASFSFNLPIVRDQLGIYFAALDDERGFARKPSYDITSRQYGALAYQPLPSTIFRASLEHFANHHQRPNALTPRDLVTPWIQAGRPAWDPLNRTLTVNGATSGPFDTPAQLQAATSAVKEDLDTRPTFLNDHGQDVAWILRQIDLPGGAANEARYTRSTGAFDQNALKPLFVQPGISDPSLYDWKRINLVSGNFAFSSANTYNLEFEQQLRPNLYLQLGWFTQDFKTTNHYYLSQQTGVTVYVDSNTRWLDGTPNPYFGAPYVEYFQPDMFVEPERNENWRATLSWELDFRDQPGWRALLGRHQLMGLVTRRDTHQEFLRFREVVVSNETFTATNGADAWRPNTIQNEIYRRFYVGDPGGGVTRDPGKFPNGPLETSLRTYNAATKQWSNEPVSLDNREHAVSSAVHERTDSGALALQSFLWNDRVVVTAGWRRDRDEAINDSGWPVDPATGLSDTSGPFATRSETRSAGDSTTMGLVFKPRDWLSLYVNRSGNFTPASTAQDLFMRPIPAPTGSGTDWGIRLNLLASRLTATLNFYSTSSRNARGGAPISRTINLDVVTFAGWADALVKSRLGADVPAAVLATEVAKIMQLPTGWLDTMNNIPTPARSSIKDQGLEFQLIFNPVENWTLKMTGARQQAIRTRVSPDWDEWTALRLPVWRNAVDDRGVSFWTGATGLVGANGGPGLSGLQVATTTPAQYWAVTVDALMRLSRVNEGTVTPEEREWRWNLLTNYQFTSERWKGLGLGGALRWEDKAAIGYRAAAPDADGVVRQVDPHQPIYDRAALHADLWLSYTVRPARTHAGSPQLKFQLNLRDAGEHVRLRPIAANPDGAPSVFRITDGQVATFSMTFSF